MGCRVEDRRMYCTVSDCSFGPVCETDDEAWELRCQAERTQGYDPRALTTEQHLAVLSAIRDGSVKALPTHKRKQCGCGSGHEPKRVYSQYKKTWTTCGDPAHEPVEAPEYGWL